MRPGVLLAVCAFLVARGAGADDDPLAAAARSRRVANREATVPPQCYTRTDSRANPCWACHTAGAGANPRDDSDLQREYAFSDEARTSRWTNLERDLRPEIASIPDEEILAWIRADNEAELRRALAGRAADLPLWRPDLDFAHGFDEGGFARDGSGWRAIRYKPFPGTFWPTNGSADDVAIRLPPPFRTDGGRPSRAVYEANLALLEAALATPPGTDLRLPARYAGDAAAVPVERFAHPVGTEYLHTVRYLDPDRPDLRSTRVKELRWSRKVARLDAWGRVRAAEHEAAEKDEGALPRFAGSPFVGFRTGPGWQLQGYIEDARGRLRLQTREEHLACLGCHGSLGVTVDGTFTLPRKVPGAAGWRVQDLRGMPDVPQSGHTRPEVLTWFERARGGDEFRSNDEILERFFDGDQVREADVRRAAPGGDRDLAWLLHPGRERALALDKAYLVLVREQSFIRGRVPFLAPPVNVHRRIEETSTGLAEAGLVHLDGRLWLNW